MSTDERWQAWLACAKARAVAFERPPRKRFRLRPSSPSWIVTRALSDAPLYALRKPFKARPHQHRSRYTVK